jgi:hypothetical protein
VALVGPSVSGKSNFLEGPLRLNNIHQLIGNKNGKDHEHLSLSAQPGLAHGNTEVGFVLEAFQEVRARRRDARLENTIFSFCSPYRYNSTLKGTQAGHGRTLGDAAGAEKLQAAVVPAVRGIGIAHQGRDLLSHRSFAAARLRTDWPVHRFPPYDPTCQAVGDG